MYYFNNDLEEYKASEQGQRVQNAKTKEEQVKALNIYWEARNGQENPTFTYNTQEDQKKGEELDHLICELYHDQN